MDQRHAARIGTGKGIIRISGLALALGILSMIRFASGEGEVAEPILERFETMVRFNLDNSHVLSSARIDSLMRGIEEKPLGEKIAFWADYFYREGKTRYLFGLDPGGYVTEGRLCDDFQTDCILFLYRTTELGRSSSAREAVQFAFGTRFYGAGVQDAILPDGRVRYDHPAHLDYSEDIFQSGIWGKDVTATIGPVAPDPGNERFAAGAIAFLPKGKINWSALQSGDIVYFVLDESAPKGAEARAQGILIQHLGILVREAGTVYLVHAARSPLEGYYDGGKVVKVPLKAYLDRIDSFKGILVSRIEEI